MTFEQEEINFIYALEALSLEYKEQDKIEGKRSVLKSFEKGLLSVENNEIKLFLKDSWIAMLKELLTSTLICLRDGDIQESDDHMDEFLEALIYISNQTFKKEDKKE